MCQLLVLFLIFLIDEHKIKQKYQKLLIRINLEKV